MNILIVHQTRIPVFAYGGTERVVWDLAKALIALGHRVTFMVPEGSHCDFAPIQTIAPNKPLLEQVPHREFDVVHFQSNTYAELDYPYVVTEHGNSKKAPLFPLNTVFVSRNHAQRYGSAEFVHNGLDWSAYGEVDWSVPRRHFHFLGKGAWPVKNLAGAIAVARAAGVRLDVLGGHRLNLSHGFRFTPWPSIRFHGMVGGAAKFGPMNHSQGLIFPVRWHEPFGLAVIESLYFGCPVFGTPYGALPEIVSSECGVLSESGAPLVDAIQNRRFDARACHERAVQHFGHLRMGEGYVRMYERVLSGEKLNTTPPQLPVNGRALMDWRL